MSKQLDAIAADLRNAGALKVWSLIITFIGDSIVSRGGNVSAATVQAVLERVDIGPGALRTAFSRLASDGWIDRQKLGRRSYYQLTDEGVSLFAQATKRIYAPIVPVGTDNNTWLLGLHQDKAAISALHLDNAIVLPNRSVLIANPDEHVHRLLTERQFLTVHGDCGEIPDWVVDFLTPPECIASFAALQLTFKKLFARPPSDPLSALVARTLLIHQWRRLLLRYPSLPHELKGDTLTAENECRAFVGELYHRLTEPAEQWLESYGTSLTGGLPVASSKDAERFTQRYLSTVND